MVSKNEERCSSIIDTRFFPLFRYLSVRVFFQKHASGVVSKPPKPGFVSFVGLRLAGFFKSGLYHGELLELGSV